ncbi:phosphotransferase family protein [Mycobacterium sp. 050134]|uniref:phosphotransferase family protein n=1 Tax=Mycobacterium sp. 050134 TaxID=3096111 RepID=UPI002ED79D75
MSSNPGIHQVAKITARDVADTLADICPDLVVSSVSRGPSSYSNRLWRADTSDGAVLVRIPGRNTNVEHARATLIATELARRAGIPTVHYRTFASTTRLGLPVIVQELLPGENATTAVRAGRADIREIAARLGDWIGRLHGVRRDTFGDVAVDAGAQSWPVAVAAQVSAALSTVFEDILPTDRTTIETAFDQAIAELGPTCRASLTHGDLYLDNILVDCGKPVALLDFEAARFSDRFADFGKLSELLFEWWPDSKEPFLRSYFEHFSAAPSDPVRLRLGIGLYALNQLAYFAKWQPDLVPEYRMRLEHWLSSRA